MKKFLFTLLLLLVVGTLLLVKYFGPEDRSSESGPVIRVYLTNEKKTVSLPLEKYLVGVVAAEMPARFEKEALKAQAVAARTYAFRRLKYFAKMVNKDHPQAEVCSNPSHCQGWISDREMKEKWGWWGCWEYRRKIISAVRETEGKIIVYQGEPIEPVYHSTCGSRTENAGEVWQYSAPYLKSVPCNWDQDSPKFQAVTFLSFPDLEKKLGIQLAVQPAAKISARSNLKIMEQTSTGRVKTVKVGNKIWSAAEFRLRLGLNSTNFSWRYTDQGMEFTTIGYGHGVGMCQYGANGLAKLGKSAEEILKYYYSGVSLQKIY